MALVLQHALWPVALLAGLYVWGAAVAWWPRLWLFALPALLPVFNFAPWNGWLVLDEFDLLILATLAGAYLRSAWDLSHPGPFQNASNHYPNLRRILLFGQKNWLFLALAGLTMVSMWRGFAALGGSGPWLLDTQNLLQTQAYTEPLNSLRVGKSLVWALLFVPLMRQQLQTQASRNQASNLMGWGLWTGLVAVLLVGGWERLAFPGVFNFSTPYRTTALFWEMHTGGAAIDFYLALTAPMAFWALAQARRPLWWLVCALVVVADCYVVLTTFSRGVYVAVFLPLALLGLVRWWPRLVASKQLGGSRLGSWFQSMALAGAQAWRKRAVVVLALVLLAELVLVLVGGDFMRERLDRSQGDLAQRLEHWQRGIDLMESPLKSPWDALLGIGLGALPARYAAADDSPGMAGAVHLKTDTANGFVGPGLPYVALSGPGRDGDLAGLFSVNQRVGAWQPGNYRVLLQLRSTQAAKIHVKLCEKHQIYEGDCYYASLSMKPTAQLQEAWQKITVPLRPEDVFGDPGGPERGAVLSVTVLTRGSTVDFATVRLLEGGPQKSRELTQNGDFSQGMAYWMLGATGYYLPWHIDNLYLELLIERGFPLLLLFLALLWMALRNLLQGGAGAWAQAPAAQLLAPFWAASLAAALLLGMVSSVLDVPRVAFALFLIAFWAIA